MKILLCIQNTSRQQNVSVNRMTHTHSTRRVAVDAKLLCGEPKIGDYLLQWPCNLVDCRADHLRVNRQ